jgi:Beta-ketoacyl synthase, N-terminal domain
MSGFVLGQAAWMPGRPDVEAVVEDRTPATEGPGAQAPDVRGYPSRLLRGTSMVTRMCAAVAQRALVGAGADPRTIPAMFGSAYGEVCIAIEQLEMMVTGDGQISPALFKNSVHNTGAGVFSIAHENHTMSTSLAAGPLTLAYTLLEGLGVLDDGAPHVLVVVGDEALPAPLSTRVQWAPFAAAWVLGREPPVDDRPRIRLSELQALAGPPAEVPVALANHPCRNAHALLAAIHHHHTGRVSLGQELDEAWSVSVTLEPEEASR